MARFNYLTTALIASVITLLFTGCKKHDTPRQAPPVRVGVEVIGKNDMPANGDGDVFSGTVLSEEETVLSFNVPGTITEMRVKAGQYVDKGTVIAKVKSGNLSDQRNIAVAELEQVKDLYSRLKKLHDQNALPEVKWVEVQAKLKQAENAVSIADRAVGDAMLVSPVSGYVSEKLADTGQNILPSQPVVKIVNLKKLQIAISVPETEINRFSDTTTAVVTFNTPLDITVHGKMASKEVVADPFTRSYTVKFNITDKVGKILPGMIGSVNVNGLSPETSGSGSAEYIVPSQAVLLSADNQQFVWVVKNSTAQKREVTANELRTNGVAIEDGLTAGDTLIISGMQKVSSGTVVAPIFQ
ncbi:MAG: efflux RND transporter periplasmic adaptor subunit [Clostridiales bacterium]|nr:efflux RND transporter periplasmic adaptor subunit [Clostridiales bacterium]